MLAACNTWHEDISTDKKCPALSSDLISESRRQPVIKGNTGLEVAGRLVQQVHRKNAALGRSIALYDACRRT